MLIHLSCLTPYRRNCPALHYRRAHIGSQSPGILIFQPPSKMDSYNALFQHATSFGVERLSVFSPEQCLSKMRRGRVIKLNDFDYRNHDCKGIAVLFLNHQEVSRTCGQEVPKR